MLFKPKRFESPPADISLCQICEIGYKTAGIIKPTMSFDKLLQTLYKVGALCRYPCGASQEMLTSLTQTLLPFESRYFHSTLRESGIECIHCRSCIATCVTLANSLPDIPKYLESCLSKELICQDCYPKILESLDSLLGIRLN